MEYYHQGLEKARQQNYLGAIADFTHALEINPDYSDAYYQRGLAYFDLGELHRAVWDYTEALKLNPQNMQAYYGRALVRIALQNLLGAMSDINQAITIAPDYAAAYQLQATIQRKMSDIPGAIASYKKAGELYLNQKDVEKCRNCLELIKQLQPPPAPIPTPEQTVVPLISTEQFYAQLLERAERGDCRGAIQDLDWILQTDTQDYRAYCCRGIVRSKMDNNYDAIADFNQALRLNNQDIIALRNRGKVRLKLGEYGGAIADFNQALEIAPEDVMLYIARGNAYREIGNYPGAISDYSQALKINIDDPQALLNRAMTYTRIEEIKKAIADYQKAASKFCEQEDWGNYQTTVDKLKQLQSAVPSSQTTSKIESNPLKQRLLILVGGQWAIAERLIEQATYDYPGMSKDWYLEKVINDIEKDRGIQN